MHFKLRDQQLKTILYIYSLVYQNSENHKQKIIIDTHTHQKKKGVGNLNTTLQIVIKSHEKRTKKKGKKKD